MNSMGWLLQSLRQRVDCLEQNDKERNQRMILEGLIIVSIAGGVAAFMGLVILWLFLRRDATEEARTSLLAGATQES